MDQTMTRQEILDMFNLQEIGGDIESGDLYIAERNTGPHLLTCKYRDVERGYIVPTTLAYLYNTCECVKVVEKS